MADQGYLSYPSSRAAETGGKTPRLSRGWAGGVAAVGLVAALVLLERAIAPPPPVQAAIRPSSAAVVAAFVQHTVAPQVVVVEGTLTVADQQMLMDAAVHAGTGDLVAGLAHEAVIMREASAAFSVLTLPQTEPQVTAQLGRLLEDLALCSDQLATLLQEAAALGVLPSSPQTTAALESMGLDYGPRVSRTVSILRRAEGWLETIDHEIEARAHLPGFGPGAPPIETQISLQ